jgi:hypothetical protein
MTICSTVFPLGWCWIDHLLLLVNWTISPMAWSLLSWQLPGHSLPSLLRFTLHRSSLTLWNTQRAPVHTFQSYLLGSSFILELCLIPSVALASLKSDLHLFNSWALQASCITR